MSGGTPPGRARPPSTVPMISSGELFFRAKVGGGGGGADRAGRASPAFPGNWLARSLGSELHAFLGVGAADVNERHFHAQRQMLDDAEALALECHRSMCSSLELHTAGAEQLCQSFLARARATRSAFGRALQEVGADYDERCMELALWYYATLEREQSIYRLRMMEESLSCARLSHQVQESLRLSVFAIHLESETDRQILLKRLPSAHPQHVRCRRAASENIKPGFFEHAEGFTGINVLDVYKVENAPELERFQDRAASMEPGKVKGLFTSVTAAAVERIIALGMGGGAGGGSGGSGGSGARSRGAGGTAAGGTTERQTLFRRAWYAYHNNKSNVGYAENRISKAEVCQFPRSFSRYSTLEADRGNVEDAAARAGSAEGGGGSGAAANSGGKGGRGGGASATVPDGGGPIGDGIRYLVLCRVAVGKVFVTSKEYKGFPSVGTDPAFDCMYNPMQEEYLVLRPQQVLPEFVIQYVFKQTPGAVAAGGNNAPPSSSSSSRLKSRDPAHARKQEANVLSGIAAVPVDLSTPYVSLPEHGKSLEMLDDFGKLGNADAIVRTEPIPATARSSKLPAAWAPKDADTKSATPVVPAAGGDPAATAAFAAEVRRREQLTSWEQLRLNGARQRESILEKRQGLHSVYGGQMAKLRVRCSLALDAGSVVFVWFRCVDAHIHTYLCRARLHIRRSTRNVCLIQGWERLRLREPVKDLPPLETVETIRAEVEAAENELSRQTMRRREMESEMNALKKRHSHRQDDSRYGSRRR